MFATVSVKLTGTTLTALFAHGEHSDSPDQLSDSPASPAPASARPEGHGRPLRDLAPEKGWSLPERRSMRYRLEDVAFD